MTDAKKETTTMAIVDEPLKSMLEAAQGDVNPLIELLQEHGYGPTHHNVIVLLWVAAHAVCNPEMRDEPMPRSAFLMMAGAVHHLEYACAKGAPVAAILRDKDSGEAPS